MSRSVVLILLQVGIFLNFSINESKGKDIYVFVLNYHNQCTGCLTPVAAFVNNEQASGYEVKFHIRNLELAYAEEYLQLAVGLSDLKGIDLLPDSELRKLNLVPSEEHIVVHIRNGMVVSRETCTEFFWKLHQNAYKTINQLKDSIELRGNYNSLKYRNLSVQKMDEDRYILTGYEYENTLELYNKNTRKTTDWLKLVSDRSLIAQFYKYYYGAAKARETLVIRDQMMKTSRKIGGRREFAMDNLQVEKGRCYVFFNFTMATPDSFSVSTNLVVLFDSTGILDYWVDSPDLALGKYRMFISPGDYYLQAGEDWILPIYQSDPLPNDTLYNFALFSLDQNHRFIFRKLLPFYVPKEKHVILGRVYNWFAASRMFRINGQLQVSYSMLPFLYDSTNSIVDTLHVEPNLFVGDPSFRAVYDSVRNQGGSFGVPYWHHISSYNAGYVVVAKEFGKLSIAVYDSSFAMLHKAYFAGNSFHPVPHGNKLVYMKKFEEKSDTEVKRSWFVYEMDIERLMQYR